MSACAGCGDFVRDWSGGYCKGCEPVAMLALEVTATVDGELRLRDQHVGYFMRHTVGDPICVYRHPPGSPRRLIATIEPPRGWTERDPGSCEQWGDVAWEARWALSEDVFARLEAMG